MLNGATLSASAMVGTAVFRIVVSSDSIKNATATSQGSNRLPEARGSGAPMESSGFMFWVASEPSLVIMVPEPRFSLERCTRPARLSRWRELQHRQANPLEVPALASNVLMTQRHAESP